MTSQNMSKLMHQLGRLQGLFVNGIYGTCQMKLLVWHCFPSRLQISVTFCARAFVFIIFW